MRRSISDKLCLVPAVVLALVSGARANAQECVPGEILLELDVGSFAPKSIQRIDAVDAVVWGDMHPTAPAMFTSDPATLLDIDSSFSAGGHAVEHTLVPWYGPGFHDALSVVTTGNGSGKIVEAFELNDPALIDDLWNFNLAVHVGCADIDSSPPLVHLSERASSAFHVEYGTDGGTVFVGTQLSAACSDSTTDNVLVALDASNGFTRWDSTGSIQPFHRIYGMALDPIQDLLFVSTDRAGTTDSLHAFDILLGLRSWSVDTGRHWTAPVLRTDRLYVANLAGVLSARSPADGSEIWSLTVPDSFPIPQQIIAPLVPPFHDAIVVQDLFGRVHMARDEGGSATWSWSTDLSSGAGAPDLLRFDPVAGAIYAADDQGLIHQLDATSGAVVRSFPVDAGQGAASSLFLELPVGNDVRFDLLAGSEDGRLTRLCGLDAGVLQNALGPAPRTESSPGVTSYEDTDGGAAQVALSVVSNLGPTDLTRYEVVATGPGPCDVGRGPTACLESMEFFLLGWGPGAVPGTVAAPDAPGRLFHIDVTDRVTIVRGYGVSRAADGELVETALLSVDLDGLNLQLPGADSRLGLMGRGSAPTLGELNVPVVSEDGFNGVAARVRGAVQAVPAGATPNGGSVPGAPLTLAKVGPGGLELSWSGSCLGMDDDYAIYRGDLGDYASHEEVVCTTLGQTQFQVPAGVGSHYFLVVPRSANREGSYGLDGSGSPRPQGASACLPQSVGACD